MKYVTFPDGGMPKVVFVPMTVEWDNQSKIPLEEIALELSVSLEDVEAALAFYPLTIVDDSPKSMKEVKGSEKE